MKSLLHIGCGPKYLKHLPSFFQSGWVETRLDIDPSVNPDIIASITDLSQIETGSHDAIWSSHNIEHLFHHEAQVAAAEFLRVLNDKGWVIVTCPDVRTAIAHALEKGMDEPLYQSGMGPITPRDILFGHQNSIQNGNVYMAHKNAFDLRSLADLFKNSGFSKLYGERQNTNLWIIAGNFETDKAAKSQFAEVLKTP